MVLSTLFGERPRPRHCRPNGSLGVFVCLRSSCCCCLASCLASSPLVSQARTKKCFSRWVSLAVGIILFEGGLSLDFREIKETRGVVFRLVSIGLVITWLFTSWLAYAVGGFSQQMAILIGALLTVSGPTVILPLLRHVQPVRRIGSLAKWEGIVNDPIGAVLAALVFELILHETHGNIAGDSMMHLGRTLIFGLLLSGGTAWLLLQMLRRYLVPDYLQTRLSWRW